MKQIYVLTVLWLGLISFHQASATCDGIPEVVEANSCFTYRDRRTCELQKGCHWTPEAPVVRLCNRTNITVSIAMKFVRTNYNTIGEQGWWNLTAGQCNDFEAPNATSLSYFAKSQTGHQYWFGNGEPMCFDPSGQRFERNKPLNESCGAYTEINAYQTIPLKEDDFIQVKIEGPGQDLSPAPEPSGVPGLTARALAWCPANGNYSLRKAATVEEAKANALNSCQSSGDSCQLVIWLGTDRPACMAVLSGSGAFRAWSWTYESKEVAINQALQYCQQNGQTCTVDTAVCNHE